MKITQEHVLKLKETIEAGLVDGLGEPEPGQMCVEAAVCYALGLEHGDDPACVDPAIRSYIININDAIWPSEEARAKGLKRLSVLQLGTDTGFDSMEFVKRLAIKTVNKLPDWIPLAPNLAEDCRKAETLGSAKKAVSAARAAADAVAAYNAARAAGAAARAAGAAARAARAARAAARAARAAARAARADGDEPLLDSVKIVEDILIDMQAPGVQWLPLIDGGVES